MEFTLGFFVGMMTFLMFAEIIFKFWKKAEEKRENEDKQWFFNLFKEYEKLSK